MKEERKISTRVGVNHQTNNDLDDELMGNIEQRKTSSEKYDLFMIEMRIYWLHGSKWMECENNRYCHYL